MLDVELVQITLDIRCSLYNLLTQLLFVGVCSFVGGLSGFHIFLTSRNQTTYEHFRHRYGAAQGNPYNRYAPSGAGHTPLALTPPFLPSHVTLLSLAPLPTAPCQDRYSLL